MSYIRWGMKLRDGGKSTSYVIGDPDGLINMDKGSLIPYQEIRDWFKTKDDEEIKKELKQKLELKESELEIVCEGLFKERDDGEWDKPFEFEK